MISEKFAKKYCYEDISEIKNYEIALNDKTQMWHCHHILETTNHVSKRFLIKNNLYYNRPAKELIFLTAQQHKMLHHYANRGKYSKTYRLRANH